MKKQGTKTVTAKYGRKEGSVQEKIEVEAFEDVALADVSVKKGLTINLGDFNSARIDVMVSLPTYVEEIEEAIERASEICDREVETRSNSLRKLHEKAKIR